MTEAGEVDKMRLKSVYHSVDSILSVLKNESVNSLCEVQELLHLYHKVLPEGQPKSPHLQERKVFVVFEGLDGCGKSTISKGVAKALGGLTKATPPSTLFSLREKFDSHPSDIRKAFYSLGNYIAAQEIQEICLQKPVFLDRFWHSSAAYALAQEVEAGGLLALPPVGDPVYKWPQDLLKPDLIIFLDVDESVRYARHARRKQTTEEENQLAKNQEFRKLVLAAYERMVDIPVIHVNSNETVGRTVSNCVTHIDLFNTTRLQSL